MIMRRRSVWIVLGLMLGISVPAVASHITEPKRPIGPLQLDVYRYPDISTRIPCDGSGVVSWNNLRIEARLLNGPWPADRNAPSEHFTVRLVYAETRLEDGQLRFRNAWDNLWKHQNIPPHGQVMEIVQANNYGTLNQPGPAEVFIQVIGDETGTVREIRCPFTVVP